MEEIREGKEHRNKTIKWNGRNANGPLAASLASLFASSIILSRTSFGMRSPRDFQTEIMNKTR
jgi:hypothetical protein